METSIMNEINEYENNLNNTSNLDPNETFENVNLKLKKEETRKDCYLQEIKQG